MEWTMTESTLTPDQFGLCTRCRKTVMGVPDTHTLTVVVPLNVKGHRVYAYDLCADCVDELLKWVEDEVKDD